MKKLSLFTLALALTALVACKGKKEKEPADDEMEDMTQQVDPNASEQMTDANAAELTTEEEVFGTDLDDAKAEKAL